jgi:hypothetical protein
MSFSSRCSPRAAVLEIRIPRYIVEDIHGTLRIFQLAGCPPSICFLFLTDYSLDVARVLFPGHVFLVRGNHEFESLNGSCSFRDE